MKSRSIECPFCKEQINSLRGVNKKRYFCFSCSVEIKADSDGKILGAWKLTSNGDLIKIKLPGN